MELKDQVAIVTGGGQGLGWSVAYTLAKAGADVAIIYPPFENYPDQNIRKIIALGCRAEAYEADVTQANDVKKTVDQIVTYFGNIDILVNNAGKMTETRLIEMDENEWDDTIRTNLKSVFLCCKAVLPHMFQKKSGAIINIASQLAYKGGVGLTHYAASKAGIVALTKSLAQEVARDGIRVNAIAPGPLETNMTKPFMTDSDWLEAKEQSVAIGRLGTTEEVAPSVVFLASPAASLYVGQTLFPNGGGVML